MNNKTELDLQAAKAEIHEKIVGIATNHNLSRTDLLRILHEQQTWVVDLVWRHGDIEEDKKPADPVCPFCGGTSEIFSYYRDGGSTLYHLPCGHDRTWKNPNFQRPGRPKPTPEPQQASIEHERDQKLARVFAWLMRNEEVLPGEIERAVTSANNMQLGEDVCLTGMDPELRRAFVNEQIRRLKAAL